MSSELGYFRGKEKEVLNAVVSLDTESIRAKEVIEDNAESEHCDKETRPKHNDDFFNMHTQRIVALSAVTMRNAQNPENFDLSLGSFPNFECLGEVSEFEMAFAFHHSILGLKVNACDLAECGADIKKIENLINHSGIIQTEWPVIAGAFTSSDLKRLYVMCKRVGVASPFTALMPEDRKLRENTYFDDSAHSRKTVDVLLQERGGSFINDKIKLQDLASQYGIPGKYKPYENMSVEALWKAGKIEALVEYNRVDALIVHFLTLRLMFVDGMISKSHFDSLWTKSAKLLETKAHSKYDKGLKWFLEKLPQSFQVSSKVLKMTGNLE